VNEFMGEAGRARDEISQVLQDCKTLSTDSNVSLNCLPSSKW